MQTVRNPKSAKAKFRVFADFAFCLCRFCVFNTGCNLFIHDPDEQRSVFKMDDTGEGAKKVIFRSDVHYYLDHLCPVNLGHLCRVKSYNVI